jgi:hypothetical protein
MTSATTETIGGLRVSASRERVAGNRTIAGLLFVVLGAGLRSGFPATSRPPGGDADRAVHRTLFRVTGGRAGTERGEGDRLGSPTATSHP